MPFDKDRWHNLAIRHYNIQSIEFNIWTGLNRPVAYNIEVGESKDSHKSPQGTFSKDNLEDKRFTD